MELDGTRLERVAGAFRASAKIYGGMGTPLYEHFCTAGADDEEILALADHGMEGAKPAHLFSAVHYLLLGNPNDPLSRYFATLTDSPLPPEGAYPELVRYCREHADALRRLLRTRSVQTTYVERCRALLAPMCDVATEVGAPLNIVEIGCSAGVLLVFDKFAYALNKQGRIGACDAPLLLEGELRGNVPKLFIPRIGSRTGLDLHIIDVNSEEERRWLLALCFPELREEQARLARALDVVAETEIRLLEGDALGRIASVLVETPAPVCVFHSACLFYWGRERKAALESLLRSASRDRDIYRIGIEPSDRFDDWHKGKSSDRGEDGNSSPAFQASGEVIVTRYRKGHAEPRVVALSNSDYGINEWNG